MKILHFGANSNDITYIRGSLSTSLPKLEQLEEKLLCLVLFDKP